MPEWHRAGEPGDGPNWQIFEQQAAQGYYDDDATTAHLFKRAEDVRWSVVELAKIRAENGDISGAKNMIKSLAGPDVGAKATEVIALVQAHGGDLPGALETISPLREQNEAFLAFGRRQIENGDFDGTLKTAAQMSPQRSRTVVL